MQLGQHVQLERLEQLARHVRPERPVELENVHEHEARDVEYVQPVPVDEQHVQEAEIQADELRQRQRRRRPDL